MENTQQKLPFDYCHRWIRAAFMMAERYFSFFVVLGLIVIITEIFVGLVPYIGAIANPVLRFIYTLGSLQMMDQLFKNKSKTNPFTYESFLRLCFDEAVLKKFKNLLIVCSGVGLLTEAGMYFRIPHFYIVTLLTTVGLSLIPYMAYYTLRNPQSSDEQSMRWVLGQAWKNGWTLLVHAFFLIALATVALALCVVPFFLYFVPLTFPLAYLVYMGLCEGKSIEEVSQSWHSAGDSPSGG
jgi:hypothetical protein